MGKLTVLEEWKTHSCLLGSRGSLRENTPAQEGLGVIRKTRLVLAPVLALRWLVLTHIFTLPSAPRSRSLGNWAHGSSQESQVARQFSLGNNSHRARPLDKPRGFVIYAQQPTRRDDSHRVGTNINLPVDQIGSSQPHWDNVRAALRRVRASRCHDDVLTLRCLTRVMQTGRNRNYEAAATLFG